MGSVAAPGDLWARWRWEPTPWLVARDRRRADAGWAGSFRGLAVNVGGALLMLFIGWGSRGLLPSPSEQAQQIQAAGDSLHAMEERLNERIDDRHTELVQRQAQMWVVLSAVARHVCARQAQQPVTNPEIEPVCAWLSNQPFTKEFPK